MNQSEWDQNFTVNFWNHQKQKQKLTKMNEMKVLYGEILLEVMKFHKILPSFVKYHKISSSTGKRLKDFAKFGLSVSKTFINVF